MAKGIGAAARSIKLRSTRSFPNPTGGTSCSLGRVATGFRVRLVFWPTPIPEFISGWRSGRPQDPRRARQERFPPKSEKTRVSGMSPFLLHSFTFRGHFWSLGGPCRISGCFRGPSEVQKSRTFRILGRASSSWRECLVIWAARNPNLTNVQHFGARRLRFALMPRAASLRVGSPEICSVRPYRASPVGREPARRISRDTLC